MKWFVDGGESFGATSIVTKMRMSRDVLLSALLQDLGVRPLCA
jgi:hypothetical protein